MRSLRSDNQIVIEFKNHSAESVDVWWINYEGQAEWWFQLLPLEHRKQETYATHPWIVRRRNKGTVLCSIDPIASCSVDIGPIPPGTYMPRGAPPSAPPEGH